MEIDETALVGLDLARTPVWVVDRQGAVVVWSNQAAAALGADDASGSLGPRLAGIDNDAASSSGPARTLFLTDSAGRVTPLRCVTRPWPDAPERLSLVEGWPTPNDEPKAGLAAWLSHSGEILRASAAGDSAPVLLRRILSMVEIAMPTVLCSVLLLDRDGQRVDTSIGPRLPPDYNAALVGIEVGPGVGSCGCAMHQGRRVVVEDIAHDPNWTRFRDLALAAGLRACWSEPIRAADGTVVGSFAIYATAPSVPDSRQIEVIEAAANLASIALESERQRSEAEAARTRVAQSEAVLRSLVDASPSIIFLKDATGRYRKVNTAFCRTYGLSEDAVIDRTAAEVFGPDCAARFVADEGAVTPETPVATRRIEDAAVPGLILDTTKFLVRNEGGQIEGIGGIATDVTDRQETERRLSVLSERLALAVEASGIGVIDHDPVSGRVQCDRRMAEIYGVTDRAETMTAPEDWMACVHPEDAALVRQRFRDALSGDPPAMTSFRIVRPNGSVRHVRSGGRLVKENGRPIRIVGINMDITADVAMADAVAERSREAETANIAKSRFLANVSHELRTPLNGVLGCAQLLALSRLDVAQRRHLEVIRASGEALNDLIGDLLDTGRMESGNSDISPAPTDLRALLSSVHVMACDMADRSGLVLRARIDPSLSALRWGDGRRIRQILINLIGNAVKFTPKGTVSFTAEAISGDGVRFCVEDTGPGIPEDKQALVFERFTRLDAALDRPGTGLGLAITRNLVDLMEGRITLTSNRGQGTRIEVVLPLPHLGNAAAPPPVGTSGSEVTGPDRTALELRPLPRYR